MTNGKKIGVLFVHGIEVADKNLANRPIELLRKCFDETGTSANEALAIRPVLWGTELHDRQENLFQKSFGPHAKDFSEKMTNLVKAVNTGSKLDLFKQGILTIPRLSAPELAGLRFPALRWFVTHLGGDIVAYQIMGNDRELYDNVHIQLAESIRKLIDEDGVAPDSPLCVIAHSLGTVVASNYFYDLQNDSKTTPLVNRIVRTKIRQENPIEIGKTLAFFYTLGSPLALWASSYLDTNGAVGKPLKVVPPPPDTALPESLHTETQWVNFIDPDDIIAYPLKTLGGEYETQVKDKLVDVGPFLAGETPLAHISYWYDRDVIKPIAERLAKAWKMMP